MLILAPKIGLSKCSIHKAQFRFVELKRSRASKMLVVASSVDCSTYSPTLTPPGVKISMGVTILTKG